MTDPSPNKREPEAPAIDTELTRLVELSTLHRLQDRFAALGQVSVMICTTGGELITAPTWGSRFSELIGTSPTGRHALQENLRQLAQSPGSRVPSVCHEGLTLYSVPIVHEGRHLALIVVGTRPARPPDEEDARGIASRYRIDPDELAGVIDRFTPHTGATPQATHRFADTLADTIATLYGQAERIRQQLADLTTVHELADDLAGTRDLQEILNRTVNRVVEVMQVKACGIRLLDERTGELVIKAVCNLSDEYLQKGSLMLRDSKIDSIAFGGQTVYIADVPSDPRTRYPDNARREGIVSGLCVPMRYRAKTVGVLRVYTAVPHEFDEAEESLLHSIGSQAAAAIVNARLFEQRARTERFERQAKAAGEIQRRMLPRIPEPIEGLDIGHIYEPALNVGGDFYDFIELPQGGFGVCIADVVGKGLPAALLMASVRSTLRATVGCEYNADAVVGQVNRHLCRDTLESEYASLVYGVLSRDGREFTYCNAGHPPPLWLRDGELTPLETGGPIIGVWPHAYLQRETVELRAGDALIMVTDGITEAMNYEGQMYGSSRLTESIRKHALLDARQLARQILWDVRRFVGLADQSDDITIVVVRPR